MLIQLLSDLHLEVDPTFAPSPAPNADVLVLAGDIGGQGRGDGKGSKLGRDDPYGLLRFSPALANWPTPVLYVPGNHEYDGADVDATRIALMAECTRLGITWLDREVVVMNNVSSGDNEAVRFVGATLWTDFEVLSQWPDHMPGAMTRNMKMREVCFRAATYHLKAAATTRFGAPFDANAVADLSREHQLWLRANLATPFDGKTVAITHFAPSLKSADPRFGITPGTAGFCSHLDDLVAHADVWMHGHLHCRSDYLLNGCRVISNPLGYAKKGEQVGFDGERVIEVG
jgi:Calcineurin-like phosphoesterase